MMKSSVKEPAKRQRPSSDFAHDYSVFIFPMNVKDLLLVFAAASSPNVQL